jgi:putative ABC transport system permease protein
VNGLLLVALGVAERGILFSLIVLSLYVASRVMKVDDLSLEGSFSFGAALSAQSLLWGINPFISLGVAVLGGSLVGLVTAAINSVFSLPLLISGLVVTSALYSVVLGMVGANISLIGVRTCFAIKPVFGVVQQLVLIAFCITLVFGLVRYLVHASGVGLLLRATGANPNLVVSLGRRAWLYKTIALVISNAITAFAGALYVQHVGYFSIWMNVGILVVALTGLMIAELFSFRTALVHLVAGSVVYQALLAVVYECDIDPQWSKLLTAFLVLAIAAIKLVHHRALVSSKGE